MASNPPHRHESGQASIGLIAALPVLALAVVAAAQMLGAGHALWSSGNAARAAARAELVGTDPLSSARAALPGELRDRVRVRSLEGGVVVRLHPLLGDGVAAGRIETETSLGAGR